MHQTGRWLLSASKPSEANVSADTPLIIPEEILCIQRASRLNDWLQFGVDHDTANANKSGLRNYLLGCL